LIGQRERESVEVNSMQTLMYLFLNVKDSLLYFRLGVVWVKGKAALRARDQRRELSTVKMIRVEK
jgi:hypothetical protein